MNHATHRLSVEKGRALYVDWMERRGNAWLVERKQWADAERISPELADEKRRFEKKCIDERCKSIIVKG